MKIITLLFIFLVLIAIDKGLTIANVRATWMNFPEDVKDDPYKIERNPIAKWSFNKFGLFGGTFVMVIISLITLFVAYFLLSKAFGSSIALFILVIAYGIVISINAFFLLKYLKIII